MKIPYNYVGIKPFPADEIRLKSGHTLFIDVRFEEQRQAQVVGEVVLLPQELRFSTDPEKASLEFDTDNELQLGDTVVFNYLAATAAKKDGHILDGGVILVPYDRLYSAIRGEEIICLNGIVLVEPEQERYNTILELPQSMRKNVKCIGKVIHSGKPTRGSRSEHKVKGRTSPDMEIPKGAKVVFHWTNAIPVQPEHEMKGAITKDKMLYRMRPSDIDAIVPEGVNVTV
tara:strand:- start:3597 stop:4283 length:687 start_codon:yes stop_codon:yes gene_type:complete